MWCNRGKESVTLNLKSPAGMDILHRLLDRADAFVSNLAPGSTARLGIAAADLAERHPNVIPVEIDGYGPGGPISHKRAYDLLVQAEVGIVRRHRLPGHARQARARDGRLHHRAVRGAVDPGAAVRARSRPRRGPAPAVELSLFDVMTDVMGYQLTYTQHSGIDQQPLGVGSPAVAPYGAFPTRDGQTVVLGTTNDREWQRVAREIIDRPDLADDPRFATNPGRCAHREILDEAIGSWCAQHDLAEIQKIADDAGIGNSRYNLPSEVVVHPQLTARDRWRKVGTSKGDIQALLPPPVISGFEPPMGAVPGLGEHTDAVLARTGADRRRTRPAARRRSDRTGVARERIDRCCCRRDRDGVRTLTLNRPDRKNAINAQLWEALADALRAAARDTELRALVITGAGGAFCSGADISTPEDIHPRHNCAGSPTSRWRCTN